MKLYATIAVRVQATEILRAPRFVDKLRRAFGGRPDLRTGTMRSAIEAAAVVEGVRDALRKLGATNAISLVIDDTVLFHDRDGKPDDLGDLFLAFVENESVFGQGFDELRLAVEHREAGLHLVIEIQARPVHARGAPAIRTVVSGRIEALQPRPGEDAESYRKRAEPAARDAQALEVHRLQFEAFVARLRDAIAAAMPTASAEVETAEARVVRPEPERPVEQAQQPQQPGAPGYDPYIAYYPSPLGFVSDMLLWSTLFAMAAPPHYVVVDHGNHIQGFADDPGIQHGPTQAVVDDGGTWWDNETPGAAEHNGADPGGDHAGDHGAHLAGDDFSSDGAGADGFGSDDLGGGDFSGGFGSDDW